MNISDLKRDLIKKISETEDSVLLLQINALLNEKNENESEKNMSSVHEPGLKYESVRIFSAEEQRKINIALKQVENDEFISDEEAQIEIEKWFEEQEK
ncbi:hypothetical protein [Flavobacterium xueshanense]|uniref:Addiction module component n=1 Tax=Flavobacterium xueshanense TaxID=935223 RepID=A0A1I2IEJ5_9FLAO|nr:hypothetical protein [Flavobacterium xueshanense]SFF40822.1 hypothetical protein SAMN04488131_12012 [Flavobacterium xueshanense]